MEQTHLESHTSEMEIDLVDLVRSLWRRKRFIMTFTLVCAVAAVLISLQMQNIYESTGVLQYGSLDQDGKTFRYGQAIPDYRGIESRLLNPELFCSLLSDETFLPEEKKAKIISMIAKSNELLAKGIEPRYASSREDIRLLGGAVLGKDETNSVLGFKLSWQDSSPEDARRMVVFLSRHIKNQMAFDALSKHIRSLASDYSVRLVGLDNKKIQAEFDLAILLKKLEEIRQVMKRYPSIDESGSRQIVSTQEGGYRYLPPANQALGIESQITDIRQHLFVIERDLKIASLGAEFYKQLAAALKNDISGEFLLALFDEQVKKFAQSHDLEGDTAREFYNIVTIRNEEFRKTFDQAYRFISEPNHPSQHIKPRRSSIVLVATFLAFFIALFIVLIGYWWSMQKKNGLVTG